MAIFEFAQVASWLGCKLHVSGQISGFRQDSRAVVPGDLFFAMKGEKVDGHTFLQDVAALGAIGAVVSKEYRGEAFGLILLHVDDVLSSLQHLAKTVQAQRTSRIIGVTGSVGKTTTKEFIATLLEGKFHVGKTPGNANSQVSVPLSLLNAAGNEEVFVVEMGMSQPNEMERLVDIAPPEVAIVTKIALAHVAQFSEGMEGIAAAKGKIFSHPKTRLGILNAQAAQFLSIQQGSCPKMIYGIEEESGDLILCREKLNFYAKEKGERTSVFTLPFTAHHLCEDFMGAAAVARAMGMQWHEIIPQAQKLTVCKQRFEKIEREGIVFINDSYNANLTSMRAALTNLPKPKAGGRTIAVLGWMVELGPYSQQCHQEVAKIAFSHVDHLLCLGQECLAMLDIFQHHGKPAEHFMDLEVIKSRIFELAKEGDIVLLKGSKVNRMWQILE